MFNNPTLVIPGNNTTNTDPQSPILNLLKDHNFDQSRMSKKDQLEQLNNSYFTSEPESPSEDDIKHFKEKMEQLKQDESSNVEPFSPKVQKKRSVRLQEQSIIVVEEQNQAGSNFDQNQSVIIQHIDFNDVQNEQQIEQTPRWEDMEYQNNKKQKFPSNFGYQYQQPWLVEDQSNPSSSSPRQFQFDSNIAPVRKSKNTCADRHELNEMSISNMSCIAKPMSGGQGQFISLALPKNRFVPIQKKTQNLIFNHVLDRWNSEIYPQLQNGHCQDNMILNEVKTTQESDPKLIRLKQSMEMKLRIIQKQQTSKNQILREENKQLKYELQKTISQNQELKKILRDRDNIISTYKIKQKEIENLLMEKRQTVYRDQYNNHQKNIQSQQPTPTFINIKSICLNKQVQSHNVCQSKIDEHEQYLKRITELHQYIFDIEQQLVGIDIEVQKRVKIVEQQINIQFQQKLQQQTAMMKQTIQKVQLQKKEIGQKFIQKQKQLKKRESQLQQLYKEIQSQRKNMNKQKEREQINSFNRNCQQQLETKTKSYNYQSSHFVPSPKLINHPRYPIPQNNKLSPSKKNRLSPDHEYSQRRQSSIISNSKRRICDDPQRYSSRITKSLFNDFQKYPSKAYSKIEVQDHELHNINSKIQKLKNEINRQLCSIN